MNTKHKIIVYTNMFKREYHIENNYFMDRGIGDISKLISFFGMELYYFLT